MKKKEDVIVAIEKVRKYFESVGLLERVLTPQESTATVEEAARAVGCEPAHIAKTISFLRSTGPVLVVMAGDARADNAKYRARFGEKASMIPGDMVEQLIGHGLGGVCPFVVNAGVEVYLDESLKRFEYVYAAGGSPNSAVKLTPDELEVHSGYLGWVDVCKGWE